MVKKYEEPTSFFFFHSFSPSLSALQDEDGRLGWSSMSALTIVTLFFSLSEFL